VINEDGSIGVLISKVEDCFQIKGRCIVVPGIPAAAAHLNLKVGDTVVLKRPDGSQTRTTILDIQDRLDPLNGLDAKMFEIAVKLGIKPLVLGGEADAHAIPRGTELWTE
jgi:hypothetical protein